MGLIDSVIDQIEDTGRKIARRVDALIGCEEYEDASVIDRIAGLSGSHDDGNFKKRMEKNAKGLEYGDIVAVSRGIYDHYGVFINQNEVISYTSDKSDIGDNVIQFTTFSRFLRGAKEYSVLVFPDKYGVPEKTRFPDLSSCFLTNGTDIQEVIMGGINIQELLNSINYNIYSPEETVKRAKSRLGEDKYSLVFNNCEHFAIWCKTGIEESHQVNRIMEIVKPIPIDRV